MKRDLEWKERMEDGVRRQVRVKFPGRGKICWQFKRSDEPIWDYDTPPTDEDWARLEEKIEAFYNRRRCAYKDVELVYAARRAAREDS